MSFLLGAIEPHHAASMAIVRRKAIGGAPEGLDS
jgi:hypothetical protein